MAKQRILIVDDEEDICMILSYSLQKAGYETLVAHSAEEALELLQSPIANSPSPIALILLDIMMDGMSGLEMAEKLRSDIGRSHSELSDASLLDNGIPPIIFLTALSDEDTVLQGFKLGADDYISKPFRIAEVLARVAAVLRRTAEQEAKNQEQRPISNDCIVFEGIVVNKADMSLMVDGENVKTTRKEIELLCYLLTHRGQILSRDHLLNNVWDSNGYVLERTVDVHITHLRRKLGQYGKRIITKSGYGYMFSV
ncbi:MAG: response regulator transcription factor [Paludibacteraceae bacterium]|nr:response regulator transcription factor [Paludibacteraceae bacterium]